MKSLTFLLSLAAAIAAGGASQSAELPTIKPPRQEKAKTCNIGGMTGMIVPGSNTCVKLGGYVSTEVGVQH